MNRESILAWNYFFFFADFFAAFFFVAIVASFRTFSLWVLLKGPELHLPSNFLDSQPLWPKILRSIVIRCQ
jgi:hypothetical protein